MMMMMSVFICETKEEETETDSSVSSPSLHYTSWLLSLLLPLSFPLSMSLSVPMIVIIAIAIVIGGVDCLISLLYNGHGISLNNERSEGFLRIRESESCFKQQQWYHHDFPVWVVKIKDLLFRQYEEFFHITHCQTLMANMVHFDYPFIISNLTSRVDSLMLHKVIRNLYSL